jgi:hypothetical protein
MPRSNNRVHLGGPFFMIITTNSTPVYCIDAQE